MPRRARRSAAPVAAWRAMAWKLLERNESGTHLMPCSKPCPSIGAAGAPADFCVTKKPTNHQEA
ncbi:hypothetical protein NH44784_036041 [Achromobacter xylosoxidans NH44784-1996]|nr:hypothetical protein NH44784_036041 [Achromobacter xylosoxidans NH44784-1996]